MSIIATAPVPAPHRLDLADTVAFARVPADLASLADSADSPQVAAVVAEYARRYDATRTCPLGTPWCVDHHGPGWLIETDTSASCNGDTAIVKTMAPGEQFDIAVSLYRVAIQEPGEDFYDQSMVRLEAGESDLTAAQALQLAAVLTDQAMRLLAGERAR